MIAGPGRRWLHAGLIALAAVALCWPALWNGYPLIYPDTWAYLAEGRTALHGMLGHANPGFTSIRPEVYTAGIYLLHGRWSPWPVIVFQAGLTAWVLWLVVRAVVVYWTEAWYVVVVLVLCALTSAAWTASWVLPDVLGPVAYLAMTLLLCPSDTLGRGERWALITVAWWCLCAHPSHLVVAVLLCASMTALWLMRWSVLWGSGRQLGVLAAIVIAAMVVPLVVHWSLYGKASVNGTRPAFLMARLVADGPARVYLRQSCKDLKWTICRDQDRLTASETEFLWAKNGVWQTSNAADRAAMLREELPLLLGTLGRMPAAQLRISGQHFAEQFLDFHEFAFVGDAGMARMIDGLFPGSGATFARSRQGQDRSLPWVFERMLYAVIELSVAAVAGMLPWVWRSRRMKIVVVMVGLAVVCNAAVTGVLSGVSWRYQSRVEWMVVLLPILMAAELLHARRAREAI